MKHDDHRPTLPTFLEAREKFMHDPLALTPADVVVLKRRDPWYGSAAVKRWREALREKHAREKHPSDAEYLRRRERELLGLEPDK